MRVPRCTHGKHRLKMFSGVHIASRPREAGTPLQVLMVSPGCDSPSLSDRTRYPSLGRSTAGKASTSEEQKARSIYIYIYIYIYTYINVYIYIYIEYNIHIYIKVAVDLGVAYLMTGRTEVFHSDDTLGSFQSHGHLRGRIA